MHFFCSRADCRETAGTSVAGNNTATEPAEPAGDDGNDAPSKGKDIASSFAALSMEEPAGGEDDEDFGGLMVS